MIVYAEEMRENADDDDLESVSVQNVSETLTSILLSRDTRIRMSGA